MGNRLYTAGPPSVNADLDLTIVVQDGNRRRHDPPEPLEWPTGTYLSILRSSRTITCACFLCVFGRSTRWSTTDTLPTTRQLLGSGPRALGRPKSAHIQMCLAPGSHVGLPSRCMLRLITGGPSRLKFHPHPHINTHCAPLHHISPSLVHSHVQTTRPRNVGPRHAAPASARPAVLFIGLKHPPHYRQAVRLFRCDRHFGAVERGPRRGGDAAAEQGHPGRR